MNDLNCDITGATSMNFRLKTNLYIALDASWAYAAVYPAISYLLDNIEVSKFGSSITLVSAFDGTPITGRIFSVTEFHSLYTLSMHQSCKFKGFLFVRFALPSALSR